MPAIQAPIEITTPNKRYNPVGQCIYCGTHIRALTKEHIIAHGLAGNSLVLPKSSCRACADKTRDAENACLRHLWWPFRTRIGAPNSGKQNPKRFLVRQMKVTNLNPDGTIEGYDKTAETSVEPMEYPFVFLSYKFEFPGIIIGRDPNAETKIEVLARINEEEFRKFAPNDKDGFRIAPMDLDSYCRMLCKIAHSYAIAELGLGSFRPFLQRFIRGRKLKHAWHWIGSDTVIPPAATHLHDIQWSVPTIDGIVYVMVSMRLFSFMGSPRYHIIVGELIRPVDQLPFLQQPLYTIDVKAPLPISEMTKMGR